MGGSQNGLADTQAVIRFITSSQTTGRQAYRYNLLQADRQTGRQACRYNLLPAGRQTGRHIDIIYHKQTDRQGDI